MRNGDSFNTLIIKNINIHKWFLVWVIRLYLCLCLYLKILLLSIAHTTISIYITITLPIIYTIKNTEIKKYRFKKIVSEMLERLLDS